MPQLFPSPCQFNQPEYKICAKVQSALNCWFGLEGTNRLLQAASKAISSTAHPFNTCPANQKRQTKSPKDAANLFKMRSSLPPPPRPPPTPRSLARIRRTNQSLSLPTNSTVPLPSPPFLLLLAPPPHPCHPCPRIPRKPPSPSPAPQRPSSSITASAQPWSGRGRSL